MSALPLGCGCCFVDVLCAAATIVRVAGGRVHAAYETLLALSAVGNEGMRGVIMVVHHTGASAPIFHRVASSRWLWIRGWV